MTDRYFPNTKNSSRYAALSLAARHVVRRYRVRPIIAESVAQHAGLGGWQHVSLPLATVMANLNRSCGDAD